VVPVEAASVPAPAVVDDAPAHRPRLWGICLAVAGVALLSAIILGIIGINRSRVIEVTSWILLAAGALQMISVLFAGRRAA
jgi:hypothetical protein